MWDENVIYTTDTSNKEGKRLRETLEEYNITSKEAYLNLISWSKGLENIALQRAFEQIPTGLSHTRPNGSDWYSAKSFNVETYAEILAGHSANMSPDLAFSLWFSEYEDLKANAGVSNAANGHLHTILNPEFRSFAFAKVNGQDKFNYGVGEFSYDPSENQNSLGHVGTYTMYLGSYKPSTGSSSNSSDDEKIKLYLEKLEKALEDSRMTVDAVNMLKKNYPNTIKNIVDDLDKLVAKAIKLQEEGQKILDSYK
ncbi:MAG: CAP domain-containing protein [Anaerococcus sp.]|nr:CAP domain-containing protein [Anaerococcus sp.]